MRLPDGMVYIYKPEKFTINIESKELVFCKHCKWATNEPFNDRDAFICNKTMWRRDEGEKPEDFYCADGERKE